MTTVIEISETILPEFLEANVSEFVWIEKPEKPQLLCNCKWPDCRRDHE